jgi:hypothetical protein
VFDNNGLNAVAFQGLILHDVVQWQAAEQPNTLRVVQRLEPVRRTVRASSIFFSVVFSLFSHLM